MAFCQTFSAAVAGLKNIMSSSLNLIVLLLALTFLVGVTPAQAIRLDSFDGTPVQQVVARIAVDGTSSISADPIETIGSARKLFARVVDDPFGGRRLETSVGNGLFNHSQNAGIVGYAYVIWDGSASSDFRPDGLALGRPHGVNLREEGGSAFDFEILAYDFPSGRPLTLTVWVYDASDPSGQRWSSGSLVINETIAGPVVRSLAFSLLTDAGPNGPADLTNVGAIQLKVDGSFAPAADFVLSNFGTNGTCPDTTPNSANVVLDQCGVCGGDDRSCLDCQGVPNGGARLDRCQVCAGDGTSCLGCVESMQDRLQARLDSSAKAQEKLLQRVYSKIESLTNNRVTLAKVARYRRDAHALQIRNWILSWTLPTTVRRCDNQEFCVQSSNAAILSEYRTHSEQLRAMMDSAVALLVKLDKRQSDFGRSMKRAANERHKGNLLLVKQVPVQQSSCPT